MSVCVVGGGGGRRQEGAGAGRKGRAQAGRGGRAPGSWMQKTSSRVAVRTQCTAPRDVPTRHMEPSVVKHAKLTPAAFLPPAPSSSAEAGSGGGRSGTWRSSKFGWSWTSSAWPAAPAPEPPTHARHSERWRGWRAACTISAPRLSVSVAAPLRTSQRMRTPSAELESRRRLLRVHDADVMRWLCPPLSVCAIPCVSKSHTTTMPSAVCGQRSRSEERVR
jgi:hypothetical protein